MKKFFDEFKEFIMKGNVFGLAVGVVVGGAFGKIIEAIVQDIIDPLLSIIVRTEGLEQLNFTLGGAIFAYGHLIQAIITFLITALVVFILIKAINNLLELNKKKVEEEKATAAPTSEDYLKEILEELKRDKKA